MTVTLLAVMYSPQKNKEQWDIKKQPIASHSARERVTDRFNPLPTATLIAVEQKQVRDTDVPNTPPSGSHEDWMKAAGISSADYGYVDFIVSHESSWIPNRVNSSSGACGLVQSLPCSKLGSNWSDPVTALKWGDSYAKGRYGGWAKAYQAWQAQRWW